MKEKNYGKLRKKVIFYESDKVFADLKIRLAHDSLSQALFFRSLVRGYIEQDEDILNFVDKLKTKDKAQNKKEIKENRKLINDGYKKASLVGLSDEEKESIFDILENETALS